MDLQGLNIRTATSVAKDMPLLNPFNGGKTGAVFQIVGYDSDIVLDAVKKWERDKMKSEDKQEVASLLKEKRIVQAVAATTGATGFKFGADNVFSPNLFKNVIETDGFEWIIDQVEDFGGNRGNFTPETLTA